MNTSDLAVTPAASVPRYSPSRILRRLLRTFTHPLYWWYERKLTTQISKGSIPQHIGVILDGNRRFARGIGLDARMGHEYGVEKVHDLLEWCLKLGISNVTIFVFSAENFDRTPAEVEYLFGLFVRESRKLMTNPRIKANKVRVKVIGRRSKLPDAVVTATETLENSTAEHDGMLLNIAFGYGGREEIVDGVKKLLLEAQAAHRSPAEVAEHLTAAQISDYLYTAGIPDPDFIIRTSGEVRLSGFLLWQAAYSEYYFCDALWPGFRHVDFLRAIRSYQGRERRLGS